MIRTDRLPPDTVREVLALVHTAGDADGAYPLSEHVVLHLRHGGESPAVHVLIRSNDPMISEGPQGGASPAAGLGANSPAVLVGYLHVDTTDEVEGAAAELAIHPMYRRRGLGRALVREAIAIAEERGSRWLRLWAHGDHSSANALAQSLGFDRWRVLWQMRRSLYAPVPEPALPAGIRLRAFEPGTDDEAWVTLNASAFADHPDQGRWTVEDLRVRLREPWFDAAGFLLAERVTDGALLGFHWTKVHGGTEPSQDSDEAGRQAHAHGPIGEVYVLGVAPEAHGTGLGSSLTLAGLRHLRERGLDQAMLYVDESNIRAVTLYERLGFARWSTDVCFRRKM